MEAWLIVLGIIIVVWFFTWINRRLSIQQEEAKKYRELIPKLERLKELEKIERELEQREKRLEIEIVKKESRLKKELDIKESELSRQKIELNILVEEKSEGLPFLARAFDDYFKLYDSRLALQLRNKPHPALKASEQIRQITKERREAEKAARIANYLLDYSMYLAPWLDEYIGLEASELDEIIKDIHTAWEKKEKEFDEEVKRHYGPRYYEGLTPTERLQKKLDWYWEKPRKSDWQIGRDYERYIGYLYETNGWKVFYHGKKGFEDLGRDLICKRDKIVEIIQCKRWAQEKVIHEKHIYYLFGTAVEYYLENTPDKEKIQLSLFPELINKKNVIPKMVATIKVSDKAKQVAQVLNVATEVIPFPQIVPPYPSVKCNIARKTGEKIYHLPFDQQYDTAVIEEERLECYTGTVAEAEELGFRHAYRWKGESLE